jgi:leader peptidase (prepilin peptidase)/N-methyltransferase
MVADSFALAAIIICMIAFIWMSIIDLKIRILPNELNLAVAISGVVFHVATGWAYLSVAGAIWGLLIGGGVLLLIRAVANHIYQADTLGLGDVKLLAAVGVWLGPQETMMALSLGAMAGLFHGIGYLLYQNIIHKKGYSFRRLEIPAGPGFVVGAVFVGLWMFRDLRLFGIGQGEFY